LRWQCVAIWWLFKSILYALGVMKTARGWETCLGLFAKRQSVVCSVCRGTNIGNARDLLGLVEFSQVVRKQHAITLPIGVVKDNPFPFFGGDRVGQM
jgi:hypothetical protein